MADLANLIERLDDFNKRLVSIGDSGMSPEGQSNAIALLTVMRAGLFRDARDALADAKVRRDTGQ